MSFLFFFNDSKKYYVCQGNKLGYDIWVKPSMSLSTDRRLILQQKADFGYLRFKKMTD